MESICPNDLKMGRTGAICIGVLIARGALSLLTLVLVPSLIASHPVLLEAIRGSTSALVEGGAFARLGRAPIVLVLIAPIPALMFADPFCWWAGRLWGPAAARYVGGAGPRGRRRTERAVRAVERYDSFAVLLAPFLPIPSALVYAAAGWGGMRFWRFLVLDIAGTLLWIGLIVGLGYGIGHSAVKVAHDISHYSLIATLALVAVIFVAAFWRTARDGGFADAPPAEEPPAEPLP
jgi:membrane-associated protein